jgi:hypothetical protein
MASICCALDRIKRDLRSFLTDAVILSAATQAGHRWRNRKWGPVETVHLFILQVLNFNTAMTHLRHLSRKAIKAPAYCRARKRLPLKVLQELLVESSKTMRHAASSKDGLWCGLRAYLVDGSSTIAPDTPDSQKAFGQPTGCKKGCGFPVPKILALFDAFTGMIVQVLGFPLYTHEASKVWMLHPMLMAGDLLVADRGFCSFVHLAMLASRGVHGLFRLHQKTIVDFRPHRKHRRKYCNGQKVPKGKPVPHSKFIKRLGKHDQIVEWFKPRSKPRWMSKERFAELAESLMVRGREKGVISRSSPTTAFSAGPADAASFRCQGRWPSSAPSGPGRTAGRDRGRGARRQVLSHSAPDPPWSSIEPASPPARARAARQSCSGGRVLSRANSIASPAPWPPGSPAAGCAPHSGRRSRNDDPAESGSCGNGSCTNSRVPR